MGENEIDINIKNAIEEYQCPGCVVGGDISCYEKGDSLECDKHVSGTTMIPIGRIFLGMPKGFNRHGPVEGMSIDIFKTFSDGWGYTKLNIPVWKYLDNNGNTLVRGISPRINAPFIHVFLEDCIDKIDCTEITKIDLDGMD